MAKDTKWTTKVSFIGLRATTANFIFLINSTHLVMGRILAAVYNPPKIPIVKVHVDIAQGKEEYFKSSIYANVCQ